MAWNRPSEDKVKVRGEGEQRNVHLRGLVTGSVVVLGAAVAAWWLWPERESAGETPPPRTLRQIKEVKPAAAPKAAEVPRPPTEAEIRQQKIKYYEDVFKGKEMPLPIKQLIRNLKNNPKEITIHAEFPFVNHSSEREIANIMSAEPGSYFLMAPTFDDNFDRDFINALVDKLEAEDGDSDEVKAAKKDIESIKKELAAICRKEGKKPSEVMNEYANSLFDLGQFQHDLEDELNTLYANEEVSDDDYKDFCDAANKMLESRGLKPIPYPDLTIRNLEFLHDQHESQQEKGAKE